MIASIVIVHPPAFFANKLKEFLVRLSLFPLQQTKKAVTPNPSASRLPHQDRIEAAMIVSCPYSNSNNRRAFISRSTNRGRVFDVFSGCPRLRRDKAGRNLSLSLKHSVTRLRIRAFFPGYRGLSCVLQNAPCRFAQTDHRIFSNGRIAVRAIGNKLKSFCSFRMSRFHGSEHSYGERQGVVRA